MWTVTYTYDVTDACGNILSGQTYSNRGTTRQHRPAQERRIWAQQVPAPAGANASTAAAFSATDPGMGYSDNCGGAVTASLTNTSVTGTDCSWTVTYTYDVKDACGNTLSGQTYPHRRRYYPTCYYLSQSTGSRRYLYIL